MSMHNPAVAANHTSDAGQLRASTMKEFESVLEKATEKGTDGVPGAAMAVIDKDGNFVYKHVKGFNGVAKDAQPLEFDQTYFIASCTKLIASIAALQAVERGLVGLDDPLDKHIPELTSQPIITAKGGGKGFDLSEPTKSTTLRHLLTHSSGSAYDVMNPTLALWRQSRGETPNFSMTGLVAKDYAQPRIFEAGEGWMYGPGLDWTSFLVSRLTQKGFEEYVEENIAKPLGIKSFTWHLSRKPEVEKKLMQLSERKEDGTLAEGQTPVWPEPIDEAGGAGLYSNVSDYLLVLSDLLKDSPTLLTPTSIEALFTPQFATDSKAQKTMYALGEFTWAPVTGRSAEGVVPNHALGGFIATHDIERENYFKPKGTLTWSGMPNLAWNINRERGLATFFATQVVPWNDEKSQALGAAFETAVWRNLSA
ncbi:beta-lactamase class C and other penicillin binding protein [Lentithecium fluviatile CBS 122367]|uniref:Beta-lactamase class C and other penicillin binding protein n=1 Tax=Lentithecium fluviatile CBS 122367 TaxID=1168545 RepID=A0A6G1IQP5_9PLEO|nr:beta-lactamase class C and other penicillin binding protein [Lentithecium fluviatile CBS 122367]